MKKRIEYWRGATDTEPRGERKEAFAKAWDMYRKGKASLVQKRYGEGDYGYIMELK